MIIRKAPRRPRVRNRRPWEAALLGTCLLMPAVAKADQEVVVRSDQLFVVSQADGPSGPRPSGEILVSTRGKVARQPLVERVLYRFADGFQAVAYMERPAADTALRRVIVDTRTQEWFAMCVPVSGNASLAGYVTSLSPSTTRRQADVSAKERAFMLGLVQRVRSHVGTTGPEADTVLAIVNAAADGLAKSQAPAVAGDIEGQAFASAEAAGTRIDAFERGFDAWADWERSPAVVAGRHACSTE